MNRSDCTTTANCSPVVAICIDCGAGLCIEHAVVVQHHVTRLAAINRIENVDPPARLMYCETGAVAHDAVAHHSTHRHVAAS